MKDLSLVKALLVCTALAAAATLLFEAALLLRAATGAVGALPHEIAITRSAVIGEIGVAREELIVQIESARRDVLTRSERQVQGLREDLTTQAGAIRSTADRRLGDTLARADAALATLDSLRRDLKPAIESAALTEQGATALLDTYRVLPAQMAATFAPSWRKLEPEVTCTLANGAGYGGCWHSRITGLMGEALNVGGVFTQKFPAMADSFTGISGDVRRFADKYVDPHPMTVKQKIWSGFKVFLGVGEAAARGGLLDVQVAH